MRSFKALALAGAANALTISTGNPFERTQTYYVNPNYQAELTSTINNSSGSVRDYLTGMMDVSSAYWIDRKSVLTGTDGTKTVEGILKDAASKSTKQLVTLMVYDLPNRDCAVRLNPSLIFCRLTLQMARSAVLTTLTAPVTTQPQVTAPLASPSTRLNTSTFSTTSCSSTTPKSKLCSSLSLTLCLTWPPTLVSPAVETPLLPTRTRPVLRTQ